MNGKSGRKGTKLKNPELLGNAIREAQIKAGISIKEVIHKSQISEATYYRYLMKGFKGNVDLLSFLRLAKVLNLDLQLFLPKTELPILSDPQKYVGQGFLNIFLGQFLKAYKFFLAAKNHFDSMGVKGILQSNVCQLGMAQCLVQQKKLEEAQIRYEKIINSLLEIGNDKSSIDVNRDALLARAYHELGVLFSKRPDFDKSCRMFKKAEEFVEISLGKKHPYFFGVISAYRIVALIKGDISEAKRLTKLLSEFHSPEKYLSTGLIEISTLYALEQPDCFEETPPGWNTSTF